MSDFQAGIFDKSRQHHVFLEFTLRPQVDTAALKTLLARLRDTESGDCVVTLALGPAFWARVDGQFSFPAFSLDDRLTSTQADLLVWIQGSDRGDLFDVARSVRSSASDLCDVQLDLDGFVYHDSRDLTGFVDGIGNPKGDKAMAAALVPEGQHGAGGSFVLSQKWVHDLDRFEALPVPEQEKIIGRTKADAVEFDESVMPEDAHVGRTDVSHNGVPQKIWRRSVPYGNTAEHGLYFLAFSCELDRFDYLLKRMYGLTDDGIQDRLLDYSRAVTSSWWYAPTNEWLAAL